MNYITTGQLVAALKHPGATYNTRWVDSLEEGNSFVVVTRNGEPIFEVHPIKLRSKARKVVNDKWE